MTYAYQHGYVQLFPDFDAVSALWNWAHQYSSATEAGTSMGITALHSSGQATLWSPAGWVYWRLDGITQRGLRRSISVATGVRTYINSLVGTATPAAFIEATFARGLSRDWLFDAVAASQVPLTSGTTTTVSSPQMTTANWQFAFHYQVSRVHNFLIDVGMRGFFFADSPTAPNMQILGTQVWGFVGATWSDGFRDGDTGAWVL
jgi:hypothetical protein